MMSSLNQKIIRCTQCPRLIQYCKQIAKEKKRAYTDWKYWGKPVANFGQPTAKFMIVGLAPAAHGANRTGRMFTGDRSGDWLYQALYDFGFASQPQSKAKNDGLALINTLITSVIHCAPPGNKPLKEEITKCQNYLHQTIRNTDPKVILALGSIAFNATVKELRDLRFVTEQKLKFGHSASFELKRDKLLIASYHPSQQNTFTKRLTKPMFDQIFQMAREKIDS